ncbi:hypothetical protein GCM10009560_45270 [Nonomuraea longicatena]|uniref:MmpS family membrane protein n=1 Tax=Nonomuraea longicatena TaxID=83682 RepID=A0ABN1Q3Q2_9ACTN
MLAAVVLAVAGCGGAGESAAPAPAASAGAGAASQAPAPSAPSGGKHKREVTLEVNGKGRTAQPIAYFADTNGSEPNAKLPWKRTVTLELTEAELKVGFPVSVIPGSVPDAAGRLKPAECRILVDGEEVATNDGGKNRCEYTLK